MRAGTGGAPRIERASVVLPAPLFAHEAQDLAGLDREIDAPQHRPRQARGRRKHDAQVLDPQQVVPGRGRGDRILGVEDVAHAGHLND